MDKNFKLFFWGSAVSNLGNVLCSFASSIYILDVTESPFIMSLFLGYSMILNLVLMPFMGTFCEKHYKVKLMYRCDWVSFILNLSIGILVLFNLNKNTLLIVIVFLVTGNSIINAVFTPASMCVPPILVDKSLLSKAYSRCSTMQNMISVFGTVFSAVIYSLLGYPILLIINGLSYGLSAISEMFIKYKEELQQKENSPFLNETKKGFRYLLEHKELLALAKVSVLANIFISAMFSVTIPFLINTKFQLNPVFLAAIEVSIALGGIYMALRMAKTEIKGSTKKLIYTGFLWIALVFSAFTVNTYCYDHAFVNVILYISLSLCMFFCIGVCITRMQIKIDTNYAINIEENYMARVMAIRSVLASISAPLAIVMFGALFDLFSYLPLLVLLDIGVAFSALYAYKNQNLEKF